MEQEPFPVISWTEFDQRSAKWENSVRFVAREYLYRRHAGDDHIAAVVWLHGVIDHHPHFILSPGIALGEYIMYRLREETEGGTSA